MNSLRLINRALVQEEANTTFLDDPPAPSPTDLTSRPTPSPTPLSQLFPKTPNFPPVSYTIGAPYSCYGCQDTSDDGGTAFIVIFIVVLVFGVLALYVNCAVRWRK
jgi:hypothetical protein